MASPAPEINPDLVEGAPDDSTSFGTTTRGNHATFGDAFTAGNHHIDKSCVVRQNIYCAKALEASAYTVRTSNYGDENDPQFDPDHVYHSVPSPGFVKTDVEGNFLFGEQGDGGATSLDGLDDVTLSSPLLGRQYLCFDSGSQEWVNQTIILDDLADAVILDPADGDYLCYDGVSWINAGIPLGDISNVSTAGATSGGEVLQFDGASSFFFGFLNLNSLSNVDLITNAPSIGNHLEYDGTNWVPGAAGASVLSDLVDVFGTDNGEYGDYLRWSVSASKWTDGSANVVQDGSYSHYLGNTPGNFWDFRDGSSSSDPNNAGTMVRFTPSENAKSINFVNIGAGASGEAPFLAGASRTLSEGGGDTNVDLCLFAQGTGKVVFKSDLQFDEATNGDNGVNFFDASGSLLVQLRSDDNNPVNYLVIKNGDSGDPVNIFAQGADSIVDLRLRGKGATGKVIIQKDAEVNNGDLCVEGKIDATVYEIKGAGGGGFVKTNASGIFLFDQAGGGGASALNDLSDVDTTTVIPGQGSILQFDGSTTWAPSNEARLFTILDQSQAPLVVCTSSSIVSPTPVGINAIEVTNASLGNSPQIGVLGADTNVDLTLKTQGTGTFVFQPGGSNPAAGLLAVDADGKLLFNQSPAAGVGLNDLSDVSIFGSGGGPVGSPNQPRPKSFIQFDDVSGMWVGGADNNLTLAPGADINFDINPQLGAWSIRKGGASGLSTLAFYRYDGTGYVQAVVFEGQSNAFGRQCTFRSSGTGSAFGTPGQVEVVIEGGYLVLGASVLGDGTDNQVWAIHQTGSINAGRLQFSFEGADHAATGVAPILEMIASDAAIGEPLSVNYFEMENASTGVSPEMSVVGSDADIDLLLDPKGLGQVVSSSGFETSANDAYYLGDKDTDGTWRFVRSGSDLQVELRESNVYNVKGSFTP